MKKSLIFRAALTVLCAAVLLGTLGLTSCATRQTPLLTLEGQSISVNHFELILSRVKASNRGFTAWSSIADLTSGKTYDDVARESALASAKLTLAGLVLFEREGLTLPQDRIDEIDRNIEDIMNADANGSKAEFNKVLLDYGVNADILREIYIKEAKAAYVKEYLYGEEKLTDVVRQQFIDDNVAAFKQIVVRAWAYEYVTDANGDVIYYKTKDSDAAVNRIAYDEINGYPRPVKGQELNPDNTMFITDANDDVIYYISSGSDRIAYDKEAGVPSIKTDTDGQKVITYLDQAERNDLENGVVAELLASVEGGSMTNFEAKAEAYYAGTEDIDKPSTELSFLYTMENHYVGEDGGEMMTDMADALREMAVGEVRMVESESGFHILMKYETPSDAATAHAQWFGALDDIITEQLFQTRCADLVAAVAIDDAVWADVPTMAQVKANYNY